MTEQSRQDWLHHVAVQAKHGSDDAMNQLLVAPEIKNVVYKTANEKVGPTNADDIYQRVCESIWKKLHTWQEQSKITNWVKRVAFNECIDHLRKTKPQTFISMDSLPVAPKEPDQHAYIIDQEKDTILAKALQAMEERCKEMLTLFLIESQEKKSIMHAVQLKKSSFYEAFNECCKVLEQKIRRLI